MMIWSFLMIKICYQYEHIDYTVMYWRVTFQDFGQCYICLPQFAMMLYLKNKFAIPLLFYF